MRLEHTVQADVAVQKCRRCGKGQRRSNSPQRTHTYLVIQRLAHARQPQPVHEFYPVHELHIILAARVDHFFQISGTCCTRLLTEHVFPGRSASQHPFFSDSGRQRDIDGIHVSAGEQLLVTAQGDRQRTHRRRRLAFGNEVARTVHLATRNSRHHRVTRASDCPPTLASDIGGSHDAPSNNGITHNELAGRSRMNIAVASALIPTLWQMDWWADLA
jgi:hypothetical protein